MSQQEISDTVQGLLTMWWIMYFLPSIVALLRRHHNTIAIIAVNVLLGWTVIGWIIAFVWACTANLRSIYRYALPPAQPSMVDGGAWRLIDRFRPNAGRASALGKEAVRRALDDR